MRRGRMQAESANLLLRELERLSAVSAFRSDVVHAEDAFERGEVDHVWIALCDLHACDGLIQTVI